MVHECTAGTVHQVRVPLLHFETTEIVWSPSGFSNRMQCCGCAFLVYAVIRVNCDRSISVKRVDEVTTGSSGGEAKRA